MNTPTAVAARVSEWLGGRPTRPVASGTWAIACLLRALADRYPRRRLALPAFLCHNPLAAALYASWTPVFCDVDPGTGVPTPASWRQALDAGVDAVLLVHLFGNPQDPHDLARECRARGVFLIEDACQSLGATIDGQPCGSFGDTSVMSFGHTKQIDAGGGAVLASENRDLLARIAELADQTTALATSSRGARADQYTHQFYLAKARLLEDGPVAVAGLAQSYVGLVPTYWEGDAAAIVAGLDSLDARTRERRRKADLYRTLLSGSGISEVGQGDAAAPWRFCFRLPGIDRATQEAVANRVRERGVHVSNWYLPLTWLLADDGSTREPMPGATTLSAEIFQLWLDGTTSDDGVRAAATALREALP